MKQFETVTVFGLGYVGLPTAALMANAGYHILGVDTNPAVLDSLRRKEIHISEPGLRTIVTAALESGNFRVTESPEPADVHIICVPTPVEDGKSDLSAVVETAKNIGKVLRRSDLVVLESTVPPGTTTGLLAETLMSSSGLKVGNDFYLAYCPERVLPGRILKELVTNDRLIGGVDSGSAQAAAVLYSRFVDGALIKCTSLEAEICKLAENSFRDVNIAFANELARICGVVGADVGRVIELANRHPRVNILRPGVGVGGHCIPVDPYMLAEVADAELIRTARKVNDEQPVYIAEEVLRILKEKNIEKPVVVIMGVTYKADVDDVRNSPVKVVKDVLCKNGVEVRLCDPYVSKFDGEGVLSVEEATRGADMLLFAVAHSDWQRLNAENIADMRTKLVYDSTGTLPPDEWRNAGFSVFGLRI